MNQYKIEIDFQNGTIMQPDINLVKNDYNSTELIFDFDIKDGRNVFELKRPDDKIFIKDIVNNKIKLVDYDNELNPVSLIPLDGTYKFEIVNYNGDSKLTLQEYGYFYVKNEEVEVNSSDIENSNKYPILDSLINDVEGLKQDTLELIDETTKNSNYANEQGDYAKTVASEVETKVANGNFNGATFTPSVDSEGNLSFTNDKGLVNPTTINIKGPQGDKGDIGPQGPQGTQGVKGEKGDKGDTGLQGIQGEKGEPGQDGADGQPGKDGKDGTDGRDGVDGTNGQDGYTPIRGTDYWTEEDINTIKQECNNYLDEKLGDVSSILDTLVTVNEVTE